MPGRFPLTPVTVIGDPFCTDGFCGDPGAPFTFIDGGDINNPNVGDTLTTTSTCSGARIRYYRNNPAAPGGRVYLSEGPTYTLVNGDVGYSVYSEVECPDPSSPTGYDEPIPSNPSGPTTFGGFNPYIYTYFRLRNPLNGGVSGWHIVDRASPPRLLTNSFGITTAHCPACGTPQSSPPPSTVAIWSADGRSSVSVAYAANSTGYSGVYLGTGLFLYASPWAYNVSPGGINCITAPVCGSGKGGAAASWEFTNNNVTGIVLNTWGGTDSGYQDLTV